MDYVFMDESHVDAIVELEKICFSDPWSRNSIQSELRNPLSCWIVAMENGELAGYVGSQAVMGWADMMNLAVAPAFRRTGIAERLVTTLIEQLIQRDVTCLTLEVRVTNTPAISLYEKLGFVQVGLRPNYYHNPKEDALILRKEWGI